MERVPKDPKREPSIGDAHRHNAMNLNIGSDRPYSIWLILLVVTSLLAGSFSGMNASLVPSDSVELELESDNFASSKAAGDWVKAGLSDPSGQYGGSPVTSTSYTDSNGDTYLTGFLIGSVKFGTNAISAGQDAFIAKIDSSGNWGMVETAGQYAGGGFSWGNDITVDSTGNIFITGFYAGNISFGNHQLRSTSDSNGDDTTDIFVAKMSSSGSWLWAETAGGSYDSDSGNGIASDGNGGAYVAGAFNISGNWGMNGYGTNGYTDAFVARIDSTGSWDWVATGGGPGSDDASGVTVDSAGDLRVMGSFQGGSTQGAQFGSQSFNAVGSSDLFVSKMTNSGSWSWTQTAGAPSGVIIPWGFDTEGTDSYVGGLFQGTASFGSHSVTSAASSNNAFITKIDGSGAWQWANASGGTGLHFIGSIDASPNGIAVSGGFTGGASTSATFGTHTLTGTYTEMLAAVLDSNGNWVWAKSGGSAGDDGYYNYGTGGVGWTPAGDVIAVGHFCQGMGSACTATYGGNAVTATPGAYSTQLGLPPGVAVWKQASDADGDGYSDNSDNCPLIANAGQEDMDGDSIGDVCDPDADEDGILNDDDACDGPAVNWDASVWTDDIDMDGCRDIDEDDDDDEDGVLDTSDPCTGASFKLNWTSNVVNDNDMDGCHDSEEDDDDDNDGIDDTAGDDCPRDYANWGLPDGSGGFNHNSSADHDSDGCHDEVEDDDDDNDGVNDLDSLGAVLDRCPTGVLDWVSDSVGTDHDEDGCRDSDEDWDDDNDGVHDLDSSDNILDLCSPGATGWLSDETTDRDGDGCRDLDEDDDDDGDGIIDTEDGCFVQAGWVSTPLTDHDGDGCRDMDEDDNDDNDLVYDASDACAKGEIGWSETDFDGDGCRDETEDDDDDNDGICDTISSTVNVCSSGPDICPETPSGETINGDGCGTFTQVDTDGDGVFDGMDLCDEDAAVEGFDTDSDGCTDDRDGDTFTDDVDAFPDDSSQWNDRDGDGRGDNPGQLNSDDCPDTPSQWLWNVSNGTLGCAWEELDDDDDFVLNGLDNCPGSDATKTVDENGCTEWQKDDDSDGVVNADDTCDETASGDTFIEDTGCSHEQRLAAGDTNAMLKEYGLILGAVGAVLILAIVSMLIMIGRRKKQSGSMDAWDKDSAQIAAGGYAAGQPAAPMPTPMVQAGPQSVPSYAELPAGGSYVTDAAGGTWYNAPDGGQWAMQGDGSFIKN